jgi:hypothetical protein
MTPSIASTSRARGLNSNLKNIPVGNIGAIKSINQQPAGIHILRGRKSVLAQEGTPVYIVDKIVTGANTATAIEFALGGAAGVQPDSSVTVVNERQAREDSPSIIMNKINDWSHVAHQKETVHFWIGGGAMSIKG